MLNDAPELATLCGYEGYGDRWSDISEEAKLRWQRYDKIILDQLSAIDSDNFSEEEQLYYAIFQWTLASKKTDEIFHHEYLALNQMEGVHIDTLFYLEAMPRRHLQDFEAILSRLEKIPVLVDQVIELLQKGVQSGIVSPQIIISMVPAQIQSLIQPAPTESCFYEPFNDFPEGISAKEGINLQNTARLVIEKFVYPAYEKLNTYITTDYLPACRETTGYSALPGGVAAYAQRVKTHTTTTLTPQEIHLIGLNEVARIGDLKQEILEEVGFAGTLKEFRQFLLNDPQFYFEDEKSLLDAYRDLLAKIQKNLPLLFHSLPSLPCEVAPIPTYSAAAAPSAYYCSGSVSMGRPGIFYVNTYDVKACPKWEMATLALHEGLPGHHLQLTLAQQQAIPEFFQHGFTTAFVEGWGLYSEGLGDVLDVYNNPYSRYGRLVYEMHRAARLVVDTGLHALGWSRQRAINYLIDVVGLDEHESVNEVDRYLVMPGQALAYKIGELKILSWREQAKATLGERFDIRDFHEVLLNKGGCLPLEVFEKYLKTCGVID
jgi:uncharacterized protein (DUF885 family)